MLKGQDVLEWVSSAVLTAGNVQKNWILFLVVPLQSHDLFNGVTDMSVVKY